MSEPEPPGTTAGAVEWVENLPGVPDALQRLWTPHRASYVGGEGKPSDSGAGPQCPFCRAPRIGDDEASLIVRRGRTAFVVLNLYPYNPGHLLVCPYRHVAGYVDTTEDEAGEIAQLTKQAVTVARHVSAPAGFNSGMNQGEAAGAGIAAHLHQHVVPRWLGDTNFLPIVGRTKAVPQLLSDTRRLFTDAWAELFGPHQEVTHA